MIKGKSVFKRFILLLLISSPVAAQKRGNAIAFGGQLGIYLSVGPELPSPSRPVDGAVASIIERRVSGESEWQEIASVNAPNTPGEFRARLENAMRDVANPFPLADIPADKIWPKIEKYGILDSVGFWSYSLPVRLATGAMYFDSTAKKGVHYQYSVSLVDKSNRPLRILVSNVAVFPGVADLAKLHLTDKITGRHAIDLEWAAVPATGYFTFVPYRQDGLHGSFKLLKLPKRIFGRGDSIVCFLQDTSVTPYQLYRYYLLPTDIFGNPGISSDTVLAGAYTFIETAAPDSMKVNGSDSIGGLRLSWRLDDARAISSLEIYRSEKYDRGFKKLADISPQSDSFTDLTARPMTRYFYYIVKRGLLGETSPPSAKVFGLYVSKIRPIPPMIVGAVATKNGVRLSVKSSDNRNVYFHVYRSDGYHKSLHLVSESIPIGDSVTVFDDTSRFLSGKLTYAYAVRGESASHLLSVYSDTVHVRPLIPTKPPTPLALTATREGRNIQLFWDNMQSFDDALSGYIVYRKVLAAADPSRGYTALSVTPLPSGQNHFADTAAEAGVTYDYAVRSLDVFGGRSTLSAPARAGIPSVRPIPPAGLSATPTENGILLQWDKTYQPGLMEYLVYRFRRGMKPVRIATVKSGAGLEAVDSHARKGEMYLYYVVSVNKEGVESDRSDEVGSTR